MAAQDKQLSPPEVNVWVSKAPILSSIHKAYGAGVTLRSIYDEFSGLSEAHTRIQVNGEWVDDWSIPVSAGDSVLVIQVPQEATTIAIISAVVSVVSAVASFLLFEPPAGPTQTEKLDRIKGPRNEAKPYDPVPVVFGRRRITPAYAAEPYTEFRGSDEYLSMLLAPAQGPINLSEIKIGDTPIDQYADVTYDYVDGFSRQGYERLLDVWNKGVVQEVVNSELRYSDPPIVRSSEAGASRVTAEIIWPTGLRSSSEETGDAVTVQYQHNGTWYAVVPKMGFVKNASVQSVQFYNGSYWLCGNGQDARRGYNPNDPGSVNIDAFYINEYIDNGRTLVIFDADALLANNYRLGTVRAWAFTTNEFTRSFTFTPVDPVTLEKRTDIVQIRLQKAVPETAGGGSTRRRADWFSLRSETPYTKAEFEDSIGAFTDNGNFQPAIIAIKIRASEQLNGVIDNLNCVVESVVPQDWAADWSTVDPFSAPMKISRNPSELYRWAIQGNTNKIRSSDAKVDIETLTDWRDYCVAQGWETSEFVNYEETLRKVLGNIAFTGRADFSYRDGKFSVVQKVEQTVPKQIFTPKNSSGLKSRREFPPNYDGIKFKFQNADREDQVDEGTYYDPSKFANNDPTQPLAGAEITGTFRTIEFWGVTSPALAQRHARFAFFEQQLRRETYELETDIEGLVAGRGDMVRLAHDVIDVGIGQGFIAQDVTAATTFFMDEEKGAVVGTTYFFQVRQVSTGTIFSEFSASYQGGGEWLSSTAVTLSRGDLAVYGEQGKVSLDCVIIGIDNQEDYGVNLTLVNHAPAIWDEDAVALPAYNTGLTPRRDYLEPLAPVILTSQSEYAYTNQTLSVFVKADDSQSITGGAADWFTLEYRVSPETVDPEAVADDDAILWQKAGTIPSTENRFEIPVEAGFGRRFDVRAKALNRNLASAWSPVTQIVISDSPSAPVDDFTIVETVNKPETPDARWSTLTITIDPPADENYLYSIVEYRQPGQAQYLFVGKVGWENPNQATVSVFADGRQYQIRVRSVSVFGVESPTGLAKIITTTNTEDPEYTEDNPFKELPAPNVSGLELLEQGNNTEFTGKHAKFTWRKSTLNDWVAIGFEGLKGASASTLDQYFRDYWITITADDRVVREEGVVDNFYTYTFEKNAEDYERRYGVPGAYREFSISVIMRTRQNQRSERPARLAVSNPAPLPLSALSVIPGYSVIEITYLRPDDLDFAGVDIWVSTVQGFDPDTTEPTATVSDNSYVVGGLADDTTYYVRVRPFDLFGRTGTNTSAEFAVITKTGQDLSGLSGWAYEVDPADRAFIEANLAADAVPSEKIVSLTAAKLITGTLQATETITSEGLIRSVDDINNPQIQSGIGPLTIDGTTYLLWGYNAGAAVGDKLRFGIDELGNATFNGGGSFNGTVSIGAGSSGVANLSDAGALATKSAVDMATTEVLNKTADNITESGTRKWAGESGADVTANNTAAGFVGQGALSTLDNIDLSLVTDAGELAGLNSDAVVFIGAAAPDPAVNPLWQDTSTSPDTLKRWNGTAWDIVATLTLDLEALPDGTTRFAAAEAGADVTANNTAANIVNQGTLATLSAVGNDEITFNYATSVSKGGNAVDTDNVSGTSAATVKDGAVKANAGLDASGSVTQVIQGSKLPTGVSNATGGELLATNQYLGWHNGNGLASGWMTYIKSDGQFHFGDADTGAATDNFIDYNGSTLAIKTDSLIIDTGQFSLDAAGNATFGGELVAASGVFGNEATGEFIRFQGDVFEIGPNASIGSNANRTVTVGAGGDFATLNLALESLSRTVPAYKYGGFTADINMLDGYAITESVNISGVDLSWIRIRQESGLPVDVSISVASEVFFDVTRGGRAPLIDFEIGSVSNVTRVMFSVQSGSYLEIFFSGVAGTEKTFNIGQSVDFCDVIRGSTFIAPGVIVNGGASVVANASGSHCELTNIVIGSPAAGSFGIQASNGARVLAVGASYEGFSGGAGTCLTVLSGSSCDSRSSSCTSGGAGRGVEVSGSTCDLTGADYSGPTGRGLTVLSGANVTATNANFRIGASDSSVDIVFDGPSVVSAKGGIGGSNISANVFTADGILWK